VSYRVPRDRSAHETIDGEVVILDQVEPIARALAGRHAVEPCSSAAPARLASHRAAPPASRSPATPSSFASPATRVYRHSWAANRLAFRATAEALAALGDAGIETTPTPATTPTCAGPPTR
jgi:hypothetical protein